MMPSRRVILLAGLGGLTGCGSSPFLPRSGPDREVVINTAQYRVAETAPGVQLSYALMPLTPALVQDLIAEESRPLFGINTTETRVADVTIDVGDILTITIFESAAGGLFLPPEAGARPGNYVSLPAQQVDRGGQVTVPFGGTLRASGLTPNQLARAIERRLANRALEPQVVVAITDRRAGAITVVGEVNTAARFPLDPQGERLLSAIARAGGPKFPAYESMVSLQRNGTVERALLAEIAREPSQNVALRPGDVVFITREPRYFVSLGAMGQNIGVSQINRRFSFDDVRLSMADAIGRAGGINDALANPRAVFLYRQEERRVLERAGMPLPATAPATIPTVYSVDFMDPAVFFLAARFPMRHGDLMFTSNSPSSDLQKFFAIFTPGINSASSINNLF